MATLSVRLTDLATRIATETKAIRTLLNGNAADNGALLTTAKTSLVAAINEVRALALDATSTGGALITDTTTSTTDTWSSQKINDTINAQIASLAGPSAPAALNTLDELAAALGDDANFATTVTTALGNRVRVDAAQALTAVQKTQALANIGAVAAADIGNPDTDLVAVFNAGLL